MTAKEYAALLAREPDEQAEDLAEVEAVHWSSYGTEECDA